VSIVYVNAYMHASKKYALLQINSPWSILPHKRGGQTMTLGERILLLRRRHRLTQEELAAQTGVNKMTIWRLEHGAIQDVKGQVLAKMAVALETTTDYLLGLRVEEPPTAGAQPTPQPKRPRSRHVAPVA
jgi:DNA-binding XRE family transcriptional regulator